MNLNKYTPEQQRIITLTHGDHIVLAPPGTGKTEILSQRIIYALKKGIEPEEMLCLTFTNRAAKNMKERVERHYKDDNLFIGNIHSFCEEFLKKKQIIAANTAILDEEDTNNLIEELNVLRDRVKDWQLKRLFVFLKMHDLKFPKELKPDVGFAKGLSKDIKKSIVAKHKEYEKIKADSNYLDFDDLLILTYKYFIDNPDYNPGYRWIQIDEVQDLNLFQWRIIEKIASDDSHRVYFGDYDQGIFSFMGASLETLKEHTKDFTTHTLTVNFRSPQYLLDLYNEYKKHNLDLQSDYLPKSFKNELNENGLLMKELNTDQEEVRWIANNPLKKEFTTNTAILVRRNKQADTFASELDGHGVKYLKISGFDLFSRKEIKDLLAFFNILINKHNRNAWTRVIHTYVRGVKTLKEARSIVNDFFEAGNNPLDLAVYESGSLVEEFYETFQNKRVVVFDTETTGTDTDNDDIIQIAAVEIVNGKIGETFETYIKTDKDLEKTVSIHHITPEFLEKKGVCKKEALKAFREFIKDSALIAHNAEFDIAIINSNLSRENLPAIDNDYFDSIEITKRLFPKLPSYKLEYLLERFEIEGVNSHNALDDVKATANLLLFLNDYIQENDILIEQADFKKQNGKIINGFVENFKPVYEVVSGKFTENMGLNDVLDLVMSYMQTQLNYKMEEKIFEEIEKLTTHIKYHCDSDIPLYESLRKYIPEYSKYKEVDLVTGKEDIVISTIHKAKGLEWDNVIVPHCGDGEYPFIYSKSEKERQEDARLLYVALSRAKKRILVTYSGNLSRFLENVKNFFEEYCSVY